MEYLLTSAEMAEADRYTSEVIGIPSLVLMERAALGVAGAVRADCPEPGPHARVAVVAGKGNNGADAAAAGRMLLDAGYEVRFYLVSRDQSRGREAAEPLRTDSRFMDLRLPAESAADTQQRILRGYGRQYVVFTEKDFVEYRPDIILDGLFGTGLSREVSEPYAGAIRLMNQAREALGSRIYSVDIPSGIDGTTGQVMGCAVKADVTVTFAFYKRGHFLYPGCTFCGKVILHEIGITRRSLREEPEMFTFRTDRPEDLLPPRSPDGNKGSCGKVLVIAGSKGVSGACTMCAQTVLRMGAGMVRIFTHESNRVILQETVPEAICSVYGEAEPVPVSGQEERKIASDGAGREQARTGENAGTGSLRDQDLARLTGALEWSDAAAIGPGLGLTEDGLRILTAVLEYAAGRSPEKNGSGRRYGLVIDADAIRLIARAGLYGKLREAGRSAAVILTPHMAECAELFHMDLAQMKAQLPAKAKEFADLNSCTLVLKDARTLVASAESSRLYLNTSGNDGLSTAGSGDVLTGAVSSCLAQYLTAAPDEEVRHRDGFEAGTPEGEEGFRAACAACCLHGRAAEIVTQEMSRRSLCATDLIPVLQRM